MKSSFEAVPCQGSSAVLSEEPPFADGQLPIGVHREDQQFDGGFGEDLVVASLAAARKDLMRSSMGFRRY